LHDSLLQAHERLQADAALQVRAALEERDAAQGEQRRLKTISDRQARELREATEREHGLLAELERLRAGSQATVLGDDADVEGEAVDPHTLPEYEVHPDDDSGVDFGAYEHVARIGEYLANFLDVGSAGFGLDEPASHSIARRIASLPRLETNDVAAAMHVVACCYSIDPAHPGNGLIIGRLRRYLEVDEPLGDETNAACFQDAVEEMLADEEAEAAVRRLREATPDHPLLALINQPLPERLVTAVPPPPPPNDGPDEDRDPPPGEPPRKKKIRKKKKSRRREDDEFNNIIPSLRELIGDAADEEYQPSPEDIAEAERLVDE
jgi:hypothetical protein